MSSDKSVEELDTLPGLDLLKLLETSVHKLPLKETTLLWLNRVLDISLNRLRKSKEERKERVFLVILINIRNYYPKSVQPSLLKTSRTSTSCKRL
jgi:hypothetical protein